MAGDAKEPGSQLVGIARGPASLQVGEGGLEGIGGGVLDARVLMQLPAAVPEHRAVMTLEDLGEGGRLGRGGRGTGRSIDELTV
jgi:hypothetical protein